MSYRNFTPNELKTLRAARNILARNLRGTMDIFTEPNAVREYLTTSYAVNESANLREEFRVLFLDNQHRLIVDETLFFGTIDAAPVYPRVVVEKALKHGAAAVILAHNHPSGVSEPSNADRAITERLTKALAVIDVKVLDHIVVGDSTISFAERGWI